MSTGPYRAVFLSYASQDAAAAKHIADALRSAGVEVWFDQSELVGGDQWDGKIRGQISSCALFMPIISANTQARREGYFRIEWRLAAQRTHAMSDDLSFLMPVVVDDTKDAEARVPAEFKAVQWTKLPAGEATPKFCARVKALLEGEGQEARGEGREGRTYDQEPKAKNPRLRRFWWALPMFGVAMALVLVMKEGRKEPSPVPASAAPASEARQLADRARALVYKEGAARGELEAAEELCKRAVALDPTDAKALAVWSEVNTWFIYLGFDTTPERRELARGRAAQALQLAPNSFEVRFAQASYLGRSRGDLVDRTEADVKRSGEMLAALLQERPDEPRALHLLGVVQSFRGNMDEARATLRRLSENPEFAATAWSELAWSEFFTTAADYRAAEAALDRANGLQPIWGSLILKALLAVEWRGDLDLALATQRRLPEDLKQEDLGVYIASWVHLFRREPDEVLRVLEAAPRDWIHTNGYDGPKAVGLALAHRMRGDQTRADVQWQIALRLIERRLADRPDSDFLLKLKAYVLAATGQKTEAAATLRLVRDVLPAASWPRRCRVIYTKVLLGDTDGAMDLLEHDSRLTAAVLRLDPQLDPLRDLPRFKSLLARLEADPARSPKAASSSLSLSPSPSLSLSPSLPPDTKSVAVLAFANLSDDKTNEYFSDGISEELLNVLAKVPGLKVSARTSAFYFKGKEVPIPEISKQLGVAYVVEGSVRKAGDKVRITAQLIKAADGFHVWSDTFTRELKDIFAVQDEIAGLIAKALSLELGAAAPAAIAAVDPEALRLYLEGRQAWNQRTAEGFFRAEVAFRQALELAPNFARVLSGLADVGVVRRSGSGQRLAPREEIVGLAQRAIALDPSLADPHATLGVLEFMDWNFAAADRHFRRAFALNPNYAWAHLWRGQSLMTQGQVDEALAENQRALETDPLAPRIASNTALLLLLAGRPADALASADRALSLLPGEPQAQTWKSEALLMLGRTAEALRIAREARAINPSRPDFSYVLASAGDPQEVAAAVSAPDTRFTNRTRSLLAIGRMDDALAGLEADAKDSVFSFQFVLFHPAFDMVRRDPRFLKMLENLRMTDAHTSAQAWRAEHNKR